MLGEDLQALLTSHGAAAVGFGDMSAVPEAIRQDLRRAVSIAVALAPEVVAGLDDGPTVPYFEEYQRANRLLERLAAEAAEHLRGQGYRAAFPPATTGNLPPDLTMPLPHKIAATRSGLGWIGKSDLLVTARFGAAIRLTTVLTDAPLPCGTPIDESRCGTCTDCVVACPAKAVKGALWALGTAREVLYEAPACRDMARARAAAVGVDAVICGICIGVCPYTKRYLRRAASGADGLARPRGSPSPRPSGGGSSTPHPA